jgi:hypothetical protein
MMDEQCPGLLKALTPNCRAGVHCHVKDGGRIQIGDVIQVV